jgi:hypothetical protein
MRGRFVFDDGSTTSRGVCFSSSEDREAVVRVVMTLLVRSASADEVDAQVAFHFAAGVDAILVADAGIGDEARAVLTSYAEVGALHLVDDVGAASELERRTHLAQRAATEHGADWVLDSGEREFWWPRGASLEDVLVGIPSRYTVAQALVRRFHPARVGGIGVLRTSLDACPSEERIVGRWLRPVYRADAALRLVAPGTAPEDWRVPLRAWYPIELFDMTGVGSVEAPSSAGEADLVSDSRLADALARLRTSGNLALPVPDLVDDAAYAAECAMLGETSFGAIEADLGDLERRMAALEARFWPSVRRSIRRLIRRGP